VEISSPISDSPGWRRAIGHIWTCALRTKTTRYRYQYRNPDVGLVCTALVICRDSEEEAKRFHRHLRDNADLVAARNLSVQSGVDVDAVPPEKQEEFLRDMAMSPGNVTLVGTAEQIAEQIAELRSCGVDALFIGFHDYLEEMPQFGERIMPLLEQMGVRLPVQAASKI